MLPPLDEAIVRVVEEVKPSMVTAGSVRVVSSYYWTPIPVRGIASGIVVGEGMHTDQRPRDRAR